MIVVMCSMTGDSENISFKAIMVIFVFGLIVGGVCLPKLIQPEVIVGMVFDTIRGANQTQDAPGGSIESTILLSKDDVIVSFVKVESRDNPITRL